MVKEAFAYSCALCKLQRLFDARRFVITNDLIVRVDFEALAFLRESARAEGEHLLTDFHDKDILKPHFWHESPDDRDRMIGALEYCVGVAAVA